MEQEDRKFTFRGFYGNHHHSLDVKNRAFVPAKFKQALSSGFMLTKGFDNCLHGYTFEEWDKLTSRFDPIPFTNSDGRKFKRSFVGNATDVEVDKQMRFLIPQDLREYAHLSKEICFIGMKDYFEIWDSESLRKLNVEYDINAEELAEKMQKYLSFGEQAANGQAAVNPAAG